ncbi:MAG TPA: hypothetical protein VK824_02015, partial [Planctomycetota bacterium]|nr:hypothetical protein [Planctomycetota bacterium]
MAIAAAPASSPSPAPALPPDGTRLASGADPAARRSIRCAAMSAPAEWLLLCLLLVAAAMSGAFARLLRLPPAPVAVLFGVLLARGPSAVLDARAAAALQPAASIALCVAALVTGLKLTTPGTFLRERAAVAPHLLAETVLVPALVWLALVLLGGVPAQVALLVGLMALGSMADIVQQSAHRASGPAGSLIDALAAVARADLAASLGLAMAAVFALRLHFDPPALAHGIELPLAACSLGLGA